MDFKVSAVHQIEMTSRCNLRCKYCPSPNLGREKMDISRENYSLALGWAYYYIGKGTQNELNLTGIGESTMHPDFVEFVSMAAKTADGRVPLIIATNGILFTDELAKEIAPYKPWIWVSMHRPEKAGPAIEVARKYGLLKGVSSDPAEASIDWAGQVDWHVSAPRMKCQWIPSGRIFVMADGRISTCCLDASGSGVIGDIKTFNPNTTRTKMYDLCYNCTSKIVVTDEERRLANA